MRTAFAAVSGALYAGGLLFLPFFRLRPNRTATGGGVGLLAAAAPWAALAALPLLAFVAASLATRRGRTSAPRLAALILASLSFPLLLCALGAGSEALASAAPAAARVGLGPGFWLAASASYGLNLALAPLAGRLSRRFMRMAGLSAMLALLLLALAGGLGSLAMAREYASRREAFLAAFARHAAYAFFPTVAAALLALPLGRAASRRPGLEKPLFLVASAAQTIPTLSLLGLLVLPLSALSTAVPALRAIGFGGVGWAPASIALFLYAMLPMAANARAGFALVPEAALDAGRGLGMDDGNLLLRVELPLAAPFLVAGFRTALAQNLGNAVLAGLIGGGGMGSIVFLGLAQAAPDLILLGALPVVIAAFAVDRLLGGVEEAAGRRAGNAPPRGIVPVSGTEAAA